MAKELWHPDIIITEELAKDLIAKQFPELVPIKIKCIGEGWDNKVFLVNHQYIFRFPHRKVAASLIERENTVLAHLHNRVNLNIPYPIFMGNPESHYPYHFHGYQMIQGQSGNHAHLSDTERTKSITKLAEFLKGLHSISETKARAIGSKEQVFDRTDVVRAVEILTDHMQKINARNIAFINTKVFSEEIKTATAVVLPKTKVLVHGDLYCRHLMFEKEELVGIIDWGDVGINNPVVDLAAIFSFYPAECHQDFFDVYGEIDSQIYTYARFLGLYNAITVLLYGHEVQDASLVQEAKASIMRINAKLLYRG